MAYLIIGMWFFFAGLLLVSREGVGVPLFIDFGRYEDAVGVVFVAIGSALFWRFWRYMKDGR